MRKRKTRKGKGSEGSLHHSDISRLRSFLPPLPRFDFLTPRLSEMTFLVSENDKYPEVSSRTFSQDGENAPGYEEGSCDNHQQTSLQAEILQDSENAVEERRVWGR